MNFQNVRLDFRISDWNLNMVKAWSVLHGQTLISVSICQFKM